MRLRRLTQPPKGGATRISCTPQQRRISAVFEICKMQKAICKMQKCGKYGNSCSATEARNGMEIARNRANGGETMTWKIEFLAEQPETGKRQGGIIYVEAKNVWQAKRKAFQKAKRFYPKWIIKLRKAEKIEGAIII